MSEEANHLRPADLEGLGRGELALERLEELQAHILAGCEACAAALVPVVREALQRIERAGAGAPARDPYAMPFARATAAVREAARQLQAERGTVQGQFEKILAKRRAGTSEGRSPAYFWAWCELLLDAASFWRAKRLAGARELAELAAAAADRLPAECPQEAARDLQVRAWTELCNARRIAEAWAGAEEALSRAAALAAGSRDLLLIARMLDVAGSLLRDRRRIPEALEVLENAARIYTSQGDLHLAGRVLVNKATALSRASQPDRALVELSRALALIDPTRDEGLTRSLVHNTMLALVDVGDVEEAARLLWTARPLYARGTSNDRRLLDWLEGRVAASLGQRGRAARFLLDAKRACEQSKLWAEAALVALDLAAVRLAQGRSAEVLELVEGMLETFGEHGILTEKIAAVLLLREAVQSGYATVEMIHALGRELAGLPTRGPKR